MPFFLLVFDFAAHTFVNAFLYSGLLFLNFLRYPFFFMLNCLLFLEGQLFAPSLFIHVTAFLFGLDFVSNSLLYIVKFLFCFLGNLGEFSFVSPLNLFQIVSLFALMLYFALFKLIHYLVNPLKYHLVDSRCGHIQARMNTWLTLLPEHHLLESISLAWIVATQATRCSRGGWFSHSGCLLKRLLNLLISRVCGVERGAELVHLLLLNDGGFSSLGLLLLLLYLLFDHCFFLFLH